ncbi:MAG: dehydrogenase [Planctomycetaceae bacterium]|jgi:predicted dehydrogenase|nr:dehydrogenase [Planctomycetaceae bacterium]
MAVTKVEADGRNEIRIGMLGYGFMGKCHTNAFKKIPYIYPSASLQPRFLLICGRDETKVQHEAARFGYEEFCTDWQELVDDDRIDLIDNCGPDPMHVEPCIAALDAGKHVICEKPLAVSVGDARRMRDAATRSSGKAMCTFNYRFMPAVRFAKDLIAQGRIGTVYQVRVNYLQMAGHDPSLSADETWYAGWPHSGGIQGLGSHAIDQCRYLVGEIRSVSALVRTFNEDRAVPSASCESAVADEGTAAVLEFDNGAIGVMESSVVATGRKNFLSWEINGSKGSVKWDLEHPNSLFACIEGSYDSSLLGFTEISVTDPEHPEVGPWWPHGHNLGWEHGHIIEKFHFLDAVVNGKQMSPYLATFEDGYRVAVIIDAMRQSSRSGQRIELTQ